MQLPDPVLRTVPITIRAIDTVAIQHLDISVLSACPRTGTCRCLQICEFTASCGPRAVQGMRVLMKPSMTFDLLFRIAGYLGILSSELKASGAR